MKHLQSLGITARPGLSLRDTVIEKIAGGANKAGRKLSEPAGDLRKADFVRVLGAPVERSAVKVVPAKLNALDSSLLHDYITTFLETSYQAQLSHEAQRMNLRMSPAETELKLMEYKVALFKFLINTHGIPTIKLFGSARTTSLDRRGVVDVLAALADIATKHGISYGDGAASVGYMGVGKRLWMRARELNQDFGGKQSRIMQVPLYWRGPCGEEPKEITEKKMRGLKKDFDYTSPPLINMSPRTNLLVYMGETLLMLFNPGGCGTMEELRTILLARQMKQLILTPFSVYSDLAAQLKSTTAALASKHNADDLVAPIVLIDRKLPSGRWYWQGTLLAMASDIEAKTVNEHDYSNLFVIRVGAQSREDSNADLGDGLGSGVRYFPTATAAAKFMNDLALTTCQALQNMYAECRSAAIS